MGLAHAGKVHAKQPRVNQRQRGSRKGSKRKKEVSRYKDSEDSSLLYSIL